MYSRSRSKHPVFGKIKHVHTCSTRTAPLSVQATNQNPTLISQHLSQTNHHIPTCIPNKISQGHMDELAYALSGENAHYGTPINTAAPGRVPGGSTSGPAVSNHDDYCSSPDDVCHLLLLKRSCWQQVCFYCCASPICFSQQAAMQGRAVQGIPETTFLAVATLASVT